MGGRASPPQAQKGWFWRERRREVIQVIQMCHRVVRYTKFYGVKFRPPMASLVPRASCCITSGSGHNTHRCISCASSGRDRRPWSPVNRQRKSGAVPIHSHTWRPTFPRFSFSGDPDLDLVLVLVVRKCERGVWRGICRRTQFDVSYPCTCKACFGFSITHMIHACMTRDCPLIRSQKRSTWPASVGTAAAIVALALAAAAITVPADACNPGVLAVDFGAAVRALGIAVACFAFKSANCLDCLASSFWRLTSCSAARGWGAGFEGLRAFETGAAFASVGAAFSSIGALRSGDILRLPLDADGFFLAGSSVSTSKTKRKTFCFIDRYSIVTGRRLAVDGLDLPANTDASSFSHTAGMHLRHSVVAAQTAAQLALWLA